MMNIDPYGNSKASLCLADMVNGNKKHTKKVGRLWNEYSSTMRFLILAGNDSKLDNRARNGLAWAYHETMMGRIDRTDITVKMRSYLKNIMVAKWRHIRVSKF